MKLSIKGENILIILCVIDLIIIIFNRITSLNIIVLLAYILKVVCFIKYNQTFRKGNK